MSTDGKEKLTWKDVFHVKVWVGTIERGAQKALEAGYTYLDWNGRIYRLTAGGTSSGPHFEKTDRLSEELDGERLAQQEGEGA